MARIVVAGAGSASGRATVAALEAAGHSVVALTREDCDLSDAASVDACAARVSSEGPVAGLVHLVGGWRGGGGVAGQSDADWDFLAERVITTLRLTSRAFFEALVASGGRLAIVSTTGLDAPRAGNANYQAAKAAAEAWTRALGHELAKHGGGADVLRVTALYDDADRAAAPERDFSSWTHVDELAARLVGVFAATADPDAASGGS